MLASSGTGKAVTRIAAGRLVVLATRSEIAQGRELRGVINETSNVIEKFPPQSLCVKCDMTPETGASTTVKMAAAWFDKLLNTHRYRICGDIPEIVRGPPHHARRT